MGMFVIVLVYDKWMDERWITKFYITLYLFSAFLIFYSCKC